MIRKILSIQSLGLLRNACKDGPVPFGPVTLIYADNGRGKSTISAMFRACHLSDSTRLHERRTIDSDDAQVVEILLQSGTHISYADGAWIGRSPEIVVFDNEFVEKNIYAGSEVRTDQRQSLLEFALGDDVVQLKQKYDQLSQELTDITTRMTALTQSLSLISKPMSVTDFIALPPSVNAADHLGALRQRADSARQSESLMKRLSPAIMPTMTLDISAICAILSSSLEAMEKEAESAVRNHLARHSGHVENWIGNGQAFLQSDTCPFCGQSTRQLALVKAYQSYFNTSYTQLKATITSLSERVVASLGDSWIDQQETTLATNTERMNQWNEQLAIDAPEMDMSIQRTSIVEIRETLVDLLARKARDPLVLIDAGEAQARVSQLQLNANESIRAYNSRIVIVCEKIDQLKSQLASENAPELQEKIREAEAILRRQGEEASSLAAEYELTNETRERIVRERQVLRSRIDTEMTNTLDQYQDAINALLETFGAEFGIEGLKPTYVGGSGQPRTDYGISLRNKSVQLGKRGSADREHSFATALSEADKRSLAFAFFLARLKKHPELSDAIVVLDDPVASFDRNRRTRSLDLIGEVAAQCSQLIVLSHDARILRDLRDHLLVLKHVPNQIVVLTLKRIRGGYSAFAAFDVDEFCSSAYYRHYKLVTEYVNGESRESLSQVAKALRPLLEGYFHRRFPGLLPRNCAFGKIIEHVNDPTTSSPVTNLRPISGELSAVNAYASRFHHDSDRDVDNVEINDAELAQFAQRALNLIHKGG